MGDIPLLNESITYAKKIDLMVGNYNFSRLKHKKMVNLVQKFDRLFYQREKEIFINNPNEYNLIDISYPLSIPKYSPLNTKLTRKFVVRLVIKIIIHYCFRCVGYFQRYFLNKRKVFVIRKAYVDDVEGLFDLNNNDVVRFVYPFPLSFKRQYRYIKYLKSNGITFVFAGLPYRLSDYFNLLRKKTYDSLQRMETKAQILHAMETTAFDNLRCIQCAEEYELGSLDYCLLMKKKKITVHNCAHGVGKYLPYHYYSVFDVLTDAQKHYYEYFNQADHYVKTIKNTVQKTKDYGDKRVIVLLGQSSPGVSEIIYRDELKILDVMNKFASLISDCVFLYKKHPNCSSFDSANFSNVTFLSGAIVGGNSDHILQMSLFSTCQIDPNFIGKKVLVETQYIKPELAFEKLEPIIHINNLEAFLTGWLNEVEVV